MPTALIIGASRGIGLALVREYRSAGWRVLATARKSADLDTLTTLGAVAFPLDVTELNDCAALGWRLDDEKIDVAILNAGVSGDVNAMQSPSVEQFDKVMHTNVLAAMRILPIIAPMVQASSGKLAVISSIMGSMSLRDSAYQWLYRASKAALNSVLVDTSLSYKGLIAVAMHPGWVRTDMGGANAPLAVEQSAAGIRASIANLAKENSGQFFSYDGSQLSW